jgi:hypothetical protein
MSNKTLDRIGALLAQAEGTTNEAEAEAYFDAAQRLAATASIDLATARLHNKDKNKRETPERRTIRIGRGGERYLADRVELFSVIATPNGVKIDIARNSTNVYAYGFPSDIDMVEALYSSLVVQMVRDGDAYLKSGAHKAELVTQRKAVYVYDEDWGSRTRYFSHYETVTKPVHGAVARRSFYSGFRGRVGQRIRDIVLKAQTETVTEDLVVGTTPVAPTTNEPAAKTGAEIAIASRDLEVRDYYSETSTARGSWKGASSTGYSRSASSAGTEAGNRARIGSQAALTGSRTAVSA